MERIKVDSIVKDFNTFIAEVNARTKATYEEIVPAIADAEQKLNFIVERYGTDNGERLTEDYFLELVTEKVRENAACEESFIKSGIRSDVKAEKRKDVQLAS